MDDELDEPQDMELFNIDDVQVTYLRSHDRTRVTAVVKSNQPISDMKLFLALEVEMLKMSKMLGIHDETSVLH